MNEHSFFDQAESTNDWGVGRLYRLVAEIALSPYS